MSPTGIFALLLLALLVDYSSFGPDSIRDRLAFLLGLAAIRSGWDGSPVDRYTVDFISGWIDQAKSTGNSSLAQASTAAIVGVLVALLALYCVGCLLPVKASAKLGGFALLAFTPGGGRAGGAGRMSKYRLNLRLWACAWLLGMMADLAGGAVGQTVNSLVDGLVTLVAPLPNFLFGVS